MLDAIKSYKNYLYLFKFIKQSFDTEDQVEDSKTSENEDSDSSI